MSTSVRRLLLASALLSLIACTGGGLVYRDDAGTFTAIPNATVIFKDCSGTEFATVTGPTGLYSINPFNSTGTGFDSTKWVTEGPVLVVMNPGLYLGGPLTVTPICVTFNHQYNQRCPVVVNNAQVNEPCALDALVYQDFMPSTGPALPTTLDGATVRWRGPWPAGESTNLDTVASFRKACAAQGTPTPAHMDCSHL
jgi:hypothetical protein